jgi:ATP-dependent exoDNAse (exonuclease V) beta subunit
MSDILEKDSLIHFPHFAVLKASAGSGKTHTLTKRFVQFILSDRVPGNGLRNILAVTFSNNAAKEMKARTLDWLKSVFFGDAQRVEELARIVSLDKERMIEKAGFLIEEILENYSDFQVRTIDSFMTTVFKASAIDFGYNPEFDILMRSDSLMAYSFDIFLRSVREGTGGADLFDEIISLVLAGRKKDASYPWDPSAVLLEEIKTVYSTLAATGKKPLVEDFSLEAGRLRDRLREKMEEIEHAIESSGLERRSNSAYVTILPEVKARRFADLIGRKMKAPPVNKPKRGQSAASYDLILGMWEDFGELARRYTALHVLSCYTPYLRLYEAFRETVESVKRQQSKIFIEDINRNLAEYIRSELVPDIYFRIGETVFHFLIDEFQDTSPVQWRNLFPLMENSLSQRGSVFVVGDTKQAIYGFRNADYTIMKKCETENPFPSADHIVRELETNYRSLCRILEFNERIFKEIVAANTEYNAAGERSGLTGYVQKVRDGRESPGYSEVVILERDDEDPPERHKVVELIGELTRRGYSYGDIAVLTARNESAVRTTGWLNESDIPFISYSSLDIRRRKITGEIVSLLNFLDSPTDDLSFASFVLGDIFESVLLRRDGEGRQRLRDFIFRNRERRPLYKAFQKEFGALWDEYFSGLFRSAGYFPLYDLVTEVFNVFTVFDQMAAEEAALVKILEVVKDFEGQGSNSLRDFLTFAGDESGDQEWNMEVPKGENAVKVMTVHKAKGLEFPVVIILLYEEGNRGFDYIVQEDDEGVRLLKITRDTMGSDPVFEELYGDAALREKVNRLNSMYVGFTRPGEELYVIGVRGSGKGYPFDILGKEVFQPSAKPEGKQTVAPEKQSQFPIIHRHRRIEFPAGPDEMISIEERRRGEFIHRVFYFIEYVDEGFEERLAEIVRKVREETGDAYNDEETAGAVLGTVGHAGLLEYFTRRSGREVKLEQEFSDREGNLFRMDRVVLDDGRVTVIDYKTGHDRAAQDKHMLQVRSYMRILGGIYRGKRVEGIIAYIDLGEVVRLK